MEAQQLHTSLELAVDRALSLGESRLRMIGCTSTLSLSFFLTQSVSKKLSSLPHLVVVSSETEAQAIERQIRFFNPNSSTSLLTGFDASPFSRLTPSPKKLSGRLRFLSRAQSALPGQIFIAPLEALLQLCLPEKIFFRNFFTFLEGNELPEQFATFLTQLGFQSVSVVEDPGQFSIRGGVVDLFSPAEEYPVRLSLDGDKIESIRSLDPNTQRSVDQLPSFDLCQAREILFENGEPPQALLGRLTSIRKEMDPIEYEETLRALQSGYYFSGIEFLISYFYEKPSQVLDFFSCDLHIWLLDSPELIRVSDRLHAQLQEEFRFVHEKTLSPKPTSLYLTFEELAYSKKSKIFDLSRLSVLEPSEGVSSPPQVQMHCHLVQEFISQLQSFKSESDEWFRYLKERILSWKDHGYRIFVCCRNPIQQQRLSTVFQNLSISNKVEPPTEYRWHAWAEEQENDLVQLHILGRSTGESLVLTDERMVFLRDEDFFGKKSAQRATSAYEDFEKQARHLTFGDLKPDDYVVHIQHGIGQYQGLRVLSVGGVDSEFIQLQYKGEDRLYLPVYRIGQLQKYSSSIVPVGLDRLGGNAWEKTKIKVKSHLKDLASELLQLYSKRTQVHRSPYLFSEPDFLAFSHQFPYEETKDQIQAISDIVKDLRGDRPMDRLVCGDVGFGKTEVAMRAAFLVAASGRQVAVLAPTTVLTFQHLETFKERFRGWPIEIHAVNRFVSTSDTRKILQMTREGGVDILIGTHRLLSKDVEFKKLGLLIIDEEQRFGVTHKERIKKLRTEVDSLALSATPIPRTLNMSLVGIRDLSLINTPPIDRLPTRTFITRFEPDLIRRAIESEIRRGGQVYFIHNRIESIYTLADELHALLPQIRIRVAHGQMSEHQLEENMLAFFHHQVDVLVCTAIVESGMDVSRANTMFIDQAHMFGLSQLYQLRGRVGRSKERAYCYLILPRATKLNAEQTERLKIIQENSALGSGIKIAHYDLELRGSGNLLGEDQSGHVNAVGYELYMDLLQEALSSAQGKGVQDFELDPEVNLRIPALIPSDYIADIRIRLSYYKALADIQDYSEADQIEEELQDQFGPLPGPLVNLIGLMLIRKQCKDLGVKDVSAGTKTISLQFTNQTTLKPETVVGLATRENKKYSITPDNRLNVRMNEISWKNVYDELEYLSRLRT